MCSLLAVGGWISLHVLSLLDCLEEAKQYIRQSCDNKPFPKLVDEYNYMTFTRPLDFEEYIGKIKEKVEELRKNDEITIEQYEEFLDEISFLRKICLSR